ncbi:MAG: MBL fold metallo-hydrolase [Woeseiaceae bacterium]|nr:MBL fold metallo-hydrolase [Woeseiaceae bacterium]
MAFELTFHGAAEQVTGSLYVLRAGASTVVVECGLIQGGREAEARNADPLPVAVDSIDAVVLSHAHIDHTGRLPLLFKQGYDGPVYVQRATRALCEIMLPDSGYLNEKDAEWENRKREAKGQPLVEPLYTREEAEQSLALFEGLGYGEPTTIAPGLTLTFHDAGHILGSAIVELRYDDEGRERTLVFSGDLGYHESPVMNDPATLQHADAVLMESTYGDRQHRPYAETLEELGDVFETARAAQGNIMIPAFTVGRTQDLLYLMAKHHDEWRLDKWHIFLDSPMGIEATDAYARFRHLYGVQLFETDSRQPDLPNFHATRTTEESMTINEIRSGAIIIAGSGMCSGGRIHHHLRNNIWRPECHLVIVGYQAQGTLGRRLVDGADEIRLFGDTYKVRARIHTIGGLSAHADQQGLIDWYAAFDNRPPVYLVHGEARAQVPLLERLRSELSAPASIARYGQTIAI